MRSRRNSIKSIKDTNKQPIAPPKTTNEHADDDETNSRKGHVRSCGFGQERHFKLDNCFDCEVHYIRNEVNRLQIKMRRAMKEDRTLSEEQRKTAREAITREEVEKGESLSLLSRGLLFVLLETVELVEFRAGLAAAAAAAAAKWQYFYVYFVVFSPLLSA